MISTDAQPEINPTNSLTSWNFLTSPYCLTALVCGIVAVAISYYLQQETKPRREAKPRAIQGHVRRLSESAFLFMGGHSAPFTLIDTSTSLIYSLHSLPTADTPPRSDSASENSDDDSLQRYTVDGSVYVAKRLASLSTVRVLEKGLHFHNGRAVRLAFDDCEAILNFQTRVTTELFLNLLHREPHHARPQSVSLFLTTFNVGNSQPPDDLSSWLGEAANADIIAVGAQECSYSPSLTSPGPSLDQSSSLNSPDEESSSRDDSEEATEASPLLRTEVSNAESLTSSSSSSFPVTTQSSGHSSAREHFQALLDSHFPEEQYACVTKLAAWDRSLTIFVELHLLPAISDVRSDTANVGLGGVAGNKGAIGARFSVFDTDFIVINSHLAAHHKEFNRRNEDFASISQGLHGLRDVSDIDILSSPVHHTFWMGDLNYRINLDRDTVLQNVAEKKWKELQAADQLLQQREMKRAFDGFSEGETNFPPTYRYERGSRKYSDVKLRIPSWCDRVLYRSLPGCELELHEYMSADEIVSSDHSPVWARFTASLMHTTGSDDSESLISAIQSAVTETPAASLLSSPRSLSVRSLLPTSFAPRLLRLVFKGLSAKEIPEMDHGGRRIAVAKALRIDNHLGWKKHEELGEGQHADPYCTFHGSSVAELDEGEYRTSTITASQNPVWKPEDIPPIDLMGHDRKALQKRYIVITVKDENPARQDSTIGSVVLWLGGAEESGSVRFSLPIMNGGVRRGQLEGEYVMR